MVVRPSSSAVSGPRKRSDVDLDGDRAPGIVGERRGELVADGGAALGPLALLVDDEGRLRVGRGGGRGVARVERLDERIEKRLDRLLVVAPTGGGARPPARLASARRPDRPGSLRRLLGVQARQIASAARRLERAGLIRPPLGVQAKHAVFRSARSHRCCDHPTREIFVYADSDTAGETNEPPPRTASTAGIKSMAAVRLSTNPATPALRICAATVGSS